MNGIHEVTGSIPVWSTILTSLRSFGWRPLPGPRAHAADASRPLASAIPVWSTTPSPSPSTVCK